MEQKDYPNTIETQDNISKNEVIFTNINNKFKNIDEDDKLNINTLLKVIEDNDIRDKTIKDKFVTSFINEYTPGSHPGKEMMVALTMINNNIFNNINKQNTFNNDDNYIYQIIGKIKSSKSYQAIQEIEETKEKTVQEKEKTAQEKEKTAQEKEKTAQEKEKTAQEIQETKEKTVQEIQKTKEKTVQEKEKTAQEIQERFKKSFKETLPYINNIKNNSDFPSSINVKDFSLNNKEGTTIDYQYLKSTLGETLRTDQDLDDYLRYQIYLHNKSEQAKSDPSIVLSTEESASAEQFSSVLRESGIDSDQFFKNFDTGSNRLARTREQTPETIGKTTLANLSETSNAYTISGLEEATSDIPNAFDTSERAQEDNLLQNRLNIQLFHLFVIYGAWGIKQLLSCV